MTDRVEVLWVSAELNSAERSVIRAEPGESAICGTAVLPLGDVPASISYAIATNADWSTRAVQINIDAGEHSRSIRLERSDGEWMVDGTPRPDLSACSHVDLGWSPVTNTLPLRHSDVAVGDEVVSVAAWVRFPELAVVKSEQTYTRLSTDRVRYGSATFTAELVVTPDDVVTVYGADLWRAVQLHRPGVIQNDRLIPPGARVVRSTTTWTTHTVPSALLGHHQTSRWAELVVEQGTVEFVETETGYRSTASAANTVVIVPNRDHHIEPAADAVFFVRFYEDAEPA